MRLTLNHPLDAILSVCRVCVQERSSDTHSFGAQCQQFHDVGSRSNAAVDEDIDLAEQIGSMGPQLVENVDRRRSIVQCTTTVVRLDCRSVDAPKLNVSLDRRILQL